MTTEQKDQSAQENVVVTPMLSWDFTAIGAVAWRKGGGSYPCDVAYGVELRVEQAAKSGPILTADRPWEGSGVHSTQVLWDQGRYRKDTPDMGSHFLWTRRNSRRPNVFS